MSRDIKERVGVDDDLEAMVHQEGFEPSAYRLEGGCSIP